MSKEILGIFGGNRFATATGAEFTVLAVVPERGYVIVANLHEAQGVIDLDAMLGAIRSGWLVNVNNDSKNSNSKEDEKTKTSSQWRPRPYA